MIAASYATLIQQSKDASRPNALHLCSGALQPTFTGRLTALLRTDHVHPGLLTNDSRR